jgi:hypothetical protein
VGNIRNLKRLWKNHETERTVTQMLSEMQQAQHIPRQIHEKIQVLVVQNRI